MQELSRLLEDWRQLDAQAWQADREINDALIKLARGEGAGPTQQMKDHSLRLRKEANAALDKALAHFRAGDQGQSSRPDQPEGGPEWNSTRRWTT